MDLNEFKKDSKHALLPILDGEVPVLKTKHVSLLHKTSTMQFVFPRGILWLTNFRILFIPKAKVQVMKSPKSGKKQFSCAV